MKLTQPKLRTIIIWSVSLVLCLTAGSTIVHLWARRGVVRDREQDLKSLQSENRGLESTLKDIQGEDYVERIARDKLGMIREGETIVIMPDQASDVTTGDERDTMANWKKWWRLFF